MKKSLFVLLLPLSLTTVFYFRSPMKGSLVAVPWTLLDRFGETQSRSTGIENSRTVPEVASGRRYNILFLCVDDMTTDLSPYNTLNANVPLRQEVYTPNFEQLAADSLVLTQAYTQFPLCNPSRSSLLSGRRPDTTRIYNLAPTFRADGRNFTTIPQYFKQHGYRTTGVGKVFHRHLFDPDPESWTEAYSATSYKDVRHWTTTLGNGWHAATDDERRQDRLYDDIILDTAIAKLRNFSQNPEQLWFLAVGFRSTHVPTVFPERYLRHYPIETIKIPDNLHPPVGAPKESFSRNGHWVDKTSLSRRKEQRLKFGAVNATTLLLWRRAYYSALTYVDASLGRLLDELETLGLGKNTIVTFWSDHAYSMGEHGLWGKNALYDTATHCPMFLKVPGLTDGGVVIRQPTEFVDLFPTLVDVAGLPSIPQCPEKSSRIPLCHEGMSMVPLISDPSAKWKKAAFSQVTRNSGYSIRTSRYRYTEWNHGASAELYDHDVDPGENRNIAGSEAYSQTQKHLRTLLRGGWRQAVQL